MKLSSLFMPALFAAATSLAQAADKAPVQTAAPVAPPHGGQCLVDFAGNVNDPKGCCPTRVVAGSNHQTAKNCPAPVVIPAAALPKAP